MRIHHYQSGEAPRPRLSAAHFETFGRIAARRPATPRPVPAFTAPIRAESGSALLSARLEAAARAHRAGITAELVAAAWDRLAATARRWAAAWQRRRDLRATYLALRGLDDRTLRDLGMSRGEILSVAMDLDRDDETRRLRAARSANALQLF